MRYKNTLHFKNLPFLQLFDHRKNCPNNQNHSWFSIIIIFTLPMFFIYFSILFRNILHNRRKTFYVKKCPTNLIPKGTLPPRRGNGPKIALIRRGVLEIHVLRTAQPDTGSWLCLLCQLGAFKSNRVASYGVASENVSISLALLGSSLITPKRVEK